MEGDDVMIENYGDVTALSILVGLMVWYFKHTTKRQAEREDKQDIIKAKKELKHDEEQKEERNYYRKVIDGSLQKNAVLNAKSLSLQKKMMKDFKDHNGHSEKFSEKVIETLSLMCGKLNGKSPDMVLAKKRLNDDRRKKVETVKVDRRK